MGGMKQETWEKKTAKQDSLVLGAVLSKSSKAYGRYVLRKNEAGQVQNENERLSLKSPLDSANGMKLTLLKMMDLYYDADISMQRVAKIKDWINENCDYLYAKVREEMENKSNPLHDSKDLPGQMILLGIVLGREYLLSNVEGGPHYKTPSYAAGVGSSFKYDNKKNSVLIPRFVIKEQLSEEQMFQLFAYSFNGGGIHEHTHALGGRRPLNEMITAYMQNTLGLPLRSQSVPERRLSLGVRDYWQAKKEHENGRLQMDDTDFLKSFYFSGFCAPWAMPRLKIGSSMLEFRTDGKTEFTLFDVYSKKNLDAGKFLGMAGIKDENLAKSFRKVFDILKSSKWDNVDEFLAVLENAMNKVFGNKPFRQNDLREGWVMLYEPPKEKNIG